MMRVVLQGCVYEQPNKTKLLAHLCYQLTHPFSYSNSNFKFHQFDSLHSVMTLALDLLPANCTLSGYLVLPASIQFSGKHEFFVFILRITI